MWVILKIKNREKCFPDNKGLDAEVYFVSVSHKYLVIMTMCT